MYQHLPGRARTRVEEAFATLWAELAEVSLAVAVARAELLTTPELVAEPDAEEESGG